jgi:hypothetical protein
VGHAYLFAMRVCSLHPPGNLLWRPLLFELGRDDVRSGAVTSQLASFGPVRSIPGDLVC